MSAGGRFVLRIAQSVVLVAGVEFASRGEGIEGAIGAGLLGVFVALLSLERDAT